MRSNRFQLVSVALTLICVPSVADEFSSNGVKIHYTVTGQGQPVILVHELYSSAKMNWEAPGITAALAKKLRVIALDNRGHGQSDKPQAEGALGIPHARVVGYSLGGMIVMKLATAHPQRFHSVVLGGMGWLKADSPLDRFWENIRGRENTKVPVACLHGIARLGVTEAEVKAVRVPVVMIVGDRDPCRRLYVEPLRPVRPDWPERIIEDAGYLNCIMKPEFKSEVLTALAR